MDNKPLLGLDLGEKRIGVALAVMPQRMAVPLVVLTPANDEILAVEIAALLKKHGAEQIVVGLPSADDGKGIANDKIRRRVEKLKAAAGGEWIFWDESYTTRTAQEFLIESKVSRQRRKEVIDKLAAQNILQSYLDNNK